MLKKISKQIPSDADLVNFYFKLKYISYLHIMATYGYYNIEYLPFNE